MLETTIITKYHNAKDRKFTILGKEEENAQSIMIQLTTRHRILQLEIHALEHPTDKLQQNVNTLGHMNLVVSRLSMR
jgi:hypothetical protein